MAIKTWDRAIGVVGAEQKALEFAKKDGSALVIPTAANVVGLTDQTDLFFKTTDTLGIKR